MKTVAINLWNDEVGLILSAEMVLILTIAVLGIIVGLVQVQTAVVGEFQDLALAFSSFNQSYMTPGFTGCRKWWGRTSWTAGSGYIDVFEGCIGTGGVGGYTVGGGFGGFGGGYGGGYGYGEIGGGNYGGQATSAPVAPPTTTVPCETCVPEPPCETCAPGTTIPGSAPLAPGASSPIPVYPSQPGSPAPPTRDTN